MSAQTPGNTPAPFRPALPPTQVSPGPFWFLSRHHRAQRQLAQAYQAPDDPRSLQAVVDAYSHLAEATLPDNHAANALTEEMLLFIAWAKLRRNDLQGTAAWLDELGRRAPEASALVSLRWELMSRLLGADEVEDYLRQCRLLLADPQVTMEAHGAAVLETIEAVYTRLSPAACAEVVAVAHAGLARDDRLQAALSLCRCPPAFASGEEAASWAEKVEPAFITFSKVMKADALLARARAAEWAGDLRSMYLHAAAALAEKPSHPPANYWLVRTKVLLDEAEPAAGLRTFPAAKSPQWARLAHVVQAAQSPSLSQAKALLSAVEGEFGRLEQTEQQLIVKALKKSLTAGGVSDAEGLAEHTRICERMEVLAGEQSWFQINLALLELQREGNYESAVKRLEQKRLAREPRAAALARVARILAGSPRFDAARKEDACLSALEESMQLILDSPQKRKAAPDDGLGRRLFAASQSHLCVEFPALRAIADVLRFVAGTLFSINEPPAPAPDSKPPEGIPPWCAWLFMRAAFIRAAAAQEKPPTPDAWTLPTAWCADNLWALYYSPAPYSGPSWAEQAHEFLSTALGRLPSRSQELLAGLRRARADGFSRASDFDAKETGGPGDWGLGQLCDKVCEAELAFEAEYVRARGQPRETGEGARAAAERLAQKLGQLPRLLSAWWKPEVSYRLATARAHVEPSAARSALEKLAGGPKGAAAAAQLALLAIREHELGRAEQLLSSIRHATPAGLYAQALLHARRGELTPMRDTLEQLRRLFGLKETPYAPAGQKLLAVMEERAGNVEEAARLYRFFLHDHPGDAVTSARLSRLLLREAYRVGGSPDDGSLEKLLDDATEEIGTALRWARGYRLLHRLMTADDEESAGVTKGDDDGGASPPPHVARHLLVRRLLRESRAQAGFDLVERDRMAEESRWQQRTRLILSAWHALSNLWTPSRDGEGAAEPEALRAAVSCALEMEMSGADEADETFWRWRRLLERALDLESDPESLRRAEAWRQFEPWRLAEVADLWFANDEARARAAESLLIQLSEETNWTPAQRQLLRAAAAHARGLEDAYLDAFKALEPSLDALPVDDSTLWLAAAGIWCRRKNWEQIIESVKSARPGIPVHPEGPEVRLVMAMAYAQSAVNESMKGATNVAHGHAESARSLLAPFIS